ncbi:MAG TPA: type II secretion system protein N [Casimicrobiaceae bacterium]|nr:type II secretion system protein N [Casimicrobiaceae bacterium]
MSGGLYGNTVPAAAESAPLPWQWRMVRASATLAAAAVLMVVVADLVWRYLAPAPRPEAVVARTTESPASVIASASWFGARASAGNAPGKVATSSGGLSGDARLLGMVASRDGTGYALFRFADRGPVLIATGQDISPGVTLQAITTSGIRISDRGEAREIELRPGPGGATPSPAAIVSPQAAARAISSAACTPPGGARGAVYRLNAELLTGIAAKPDSWSNALKAGNDGLSIREGNAFGAMLGMKPGDRVTQANGIALRGTEDVLVAVIRPLLASQAVRVTGVRDGRPAEWIFVNASACPA